MFKSESKKAIVSLIPFGWGGAGDHLSQLNDELEFDYILVPKVLFRNKKLSKIFVAIQYMFIILITYVLLKIRRLEVTINHPQTLGYDFTALILRLSSKVNYHVVDTHFFCIKSYNLYNGSACFNCLNGENKFDDCSHFPRKQSDKSYAKLQSTIHDELCKIKFYCQTKAYKLYLSQQYGPDAIIEIKLMHTHELKRMAFTNRSLNMPSSSEIANKKYDIGYHAAFIPAKGSEYLLEMAQSSTEFKIFVPSKGSSVSTNIKFAPCTWNTGLRESLFDCKIVVCPSKWTAPVEGAVLKSMLLGLPVALLPSNTFFAEIPPNCFIPLSGDMVKDCILIGELLLNNDQLIEIGANGYEFAMDYLT